MLIKSALNKQEDGSLFLAFSAQMSLHTNSATSWRPPMFVLVQEWVTVGIPVGISGSPLIVTEQSLTTGEDRNVCTVCLALAGY